MSTPRLRRLRLDHDRLVHRFSDWAPVRITNVAGTPPERYQVTYHVRGLYATPAGQILERNQHVVEINLSLGYPRRAPQCKMVTPIFHPNFDEVSVCIGDFWAASEGLDDLIVRIGRMIAYQEYNTKSPLNGLAAKWAEQNAHLLPVDSVELAPPAENLQTNTDDKLVIKIGEEFSKPEESSDQAGASQPAEVSPSVLPVSNLRLDFGMIAVALRREYVTIGRAPGNDIQLLHESISDYHAELFTSPSGYKLRDLDSQTGCRVNDALVNAASLKVGDRVCFGDLEAQFLD